MADRNSNKLSQAGAVLREIEHLQNEAETVVRKDEFYVGAGTTDKADVYTHYDLDAAESLILRDLVLATIWRQIDLRVKRCRSLGVEVPGYEDKKAFVDAAISKNGGSS